MYMSAGASAARFRAQLLLPPGARTVESVVERLLAVQAQDARGFRLAVRARGAGLSCGDVDAALSKRRSLVVSWLLRGTLHLVRSTDYWWLHSLTAPRLVAGNASRLAGLGLDEPMIRRGVDIVLAAVADGPQTRTELRATLDAAGVPTAGQVLVHLLAAATFRGQVVRGPVRDGEHCFVDAEKWLVRPALPDRDESLARLARRYLTGHGPATAADLASYAGITLTDARRGFTLIDAHVSAADGMAWSPVEGEGLATMPPPRLLGMFDPVLHGWADRSFVTGSHTDGVVTTNGLFRATALVDGQVAGTWTLPAGAVTLRPLRPLTSTALEALETEAADVLRYLHLPARAMTLADPWPRTGADEAERAADR